MHVPLFAGVVCLTTPTCSGAAGTLPNHRHSCLGGHFEPSLVRAETGARKSKAVSFLHQSPAVNHLLSDWRKGLERVPAAVISFIVVAASSWTATNGCVARS